MKRWEKILIAVVSFILGVLITIFLRIIILFISPFVIGYIIYKLLTVENWRMVIEDIKIFFNLATVVEEVYLIKNDGILLSHHTRRIRPMVDQDILAGMLTAITDFVKDAFKSSSDLNEIKFREMDIQIARGKYVTLATIISGKDKEGIRRQMLSCVRDIEKNCSELLEHWSGNMDDIQVVDKYVSNFIEGKYMGLSSI